MYRVPAGWQICNKSLTAIFKHSRKTLIRRFCRSSPSFWPASRNSSNSTDLNLLWRRSVPYDLCNQENQFHTTGQAWRGSATEASHLDNHDLDWDVREFEDRLFDYLCSNDGLLSVGKFKTMLASTGLRETDPRLKECMQKFTQLKHESSADYYDNLTIDRETFRECVSENVILVHKAFKNQFVIPEFWNFGKLIDQLYRGARVNTDGKVATYIPQLARYNPDLWGVSVCTVDGQRYSSGDVNVPFCLQSMSKPLTYALVLNDHGPSIVHQYVGHEPSGQVFNHFSLDRNDKPHNPMINSGAIVTCSLLKPQMNNADRFDYTTNQFKRMAGGEHITFNNGVYLSEKETADRNFALGYYMREKKCYPEGTNLMEILNFYFQMCSTEVTSESGSVIAATLANGGICPITGDKILSSQAVRDTLSLMHSCGMYDYSGEFAFKVGLPAKSGVSGGIFVVVPNVMGICLWSPPLDQWGNSVRGIQFSKDFTEMFNFHNYDNVKHTPTKRDPRRRETEVRAMDVVNLLFGAFNGDVTAMRRYALLGLDMNQADYDGRTALHLAAAEGHVKVTNFLLDKCQCNAFAKDRWGFMPIDDARRFGQKEVIGFLEQYMEETKDQQSQD